MVKGCYEQLEGVAMNEITSVTSNLEEPFDFGNNKAYEGRYWLHLEDGSLVIIMLYPNQGDVPYGKFEFYIDRVRLLYFETLWTGADVEGSGPIVLDRFLPAGTIILGSLKLTSVSYVPIH